MRNRRTRVLLVENSLHTTGAFISAMAMAEALRPDSDIEFLLPANSTLKPKVEGGRHRLPQPADERDRPSMAALAQATCRCCWSTRFAFDACSKSRSIDVLIINDYYNLLGFMAKVTGWRGYCC